MRYEVVTTLLHTSSFNTYLIKKDMKKIIIALSLVAVLAPAVNAQTQNRSKTTNMRATTGSAPSATMPAQTTTAPAANTTTTTTTTTAPAVNGQQPNTTTTELHPRPDPVKNQGMIIQDHAYEPAGTAGVGVYGNGTGGSTIGSSPAGGGTGVNATTTPEDRNRNTNTRSTRPAGTAPTR